MTLASGADVKVGSYEFLIDDSQGPGYQYLPESLYSESQQIQGIEDAQTANPNVLVWTIDDFAGGAETKFFDSRLTDTYWFGKANPRLRGRLRGTPTTANTNVTQAATLAATTEAYFVPVAGKLWMGAGRDVWYSSDDGATWTQHNGTSLFAAGYAINGMTDDGNYVWVCASNGSNRKMSRIDSTSGSTTSVSDVVTAIRTLGLGRIEGKIYAWTGGHLYEYDSQATLPLAHAATNIVHQPHAATPAGTYLTDFYGGIASTDTSVVYFLASGGKTTVYEYKYNSATGTFVGRKIWNPPEGFTATHISHAMGIIYLLGKQGSDVALLSMSLLQRDPQILTLVGAAYGSDAGGTLTPRFLAASYEASVMLGVDNGTTNYIFTYDAEIDALSEIDQQTKASVGTMKAGVTQGTRRIVAEDAGSGNTLRTQRWSEDASATTNGFGWVSSSHHFNFPYDEKLLLGIQVIQNPANVNATVAVEYQIDENGSWVATDYAGNTMTTVAGAKYTNFQLAGASSNIKFRNLRLRLTGASGAELFNVTPRAYLNAYQEKWAVRLRLDDEVASLNSRPTGRKVSASELQNYVRTLVSNRNSVTLLDGRAYTARGGTGVGYISKTVVCEFPQGSGVILERDEGRVRGYADVILRSVLP